MIYLVGYKESQPTILRTYRLHLQGRRVKQARNQSFACCLLHAGFLLHSGISQKAELFVTTAVRTRNPDCIKVRATCADHSDHIQGRLQFAVPTAVHVCVDV
jgi:hypothetical protein